MYKIKQIPEDFYVEEELKLNLKDSGKYSYYILSKKNYSTNDAISAIAKVFKVKSKLINSAGLKDKHAITKQYISVSGGQKKTLKLKDLTLDFVGRGVDRINVGSLEGNHFSIVVRNITSPPCEVYFVPNYFDSQRFGYNQDNHDIGRLLIKREFKKAVDYFQFNDEVKSHIEKNPSDFIGALRKLPKRGLQFYISAYQSYLWNRCIEKYLEYSPEKESKFPIIGFNLETENREKQEIIDIILKEEGLSLKDFIVREFPEISSDSYERKVFTQVFDLKISQLKDDELNPGMKKVRVQFYLNKGNYATNVIKYMFS